MLIRPVLTVQSAVTLPPSLQALTRATHELSLPRLAAECLVCVVQTLSDPVTSGSALPSPAPHLVLSTFTVSLILAEDAVLHPVTDSRGQDTGPVTALEVIRCTSTISLVLAPRTVPDPITLPGLLDTVSAGAGHIRREAASGLVSSARALDLSITHQAQGETGAILTSPLLVFITGTTNLITAVLK